MQMGVPIVRGVFMSNELKTLAFSTFAYTPIGTSGRRRNDLDLVIEIIFRRNF